MKRLYLDNCCFNRPFDNQNQLKVYLETQAKLYIQKEIKKGSFELVWSYILDYENNKNPYEEKKSSIAPWKRFSSDFITENESILKNAESFVKKGLKVYDALHLACAIDAKCHCFITTDKLLLKTQAPEIRIMNPIDFVREEEE